MGTTIVSWLNAVTPTVDLNRPPFGHFLVRRLLEVDQGEIIVSDRYHIFGDDCMRS